MSANLPSGAAMEVMLAELRHKYTQAKLEAARLVQQLVDAETNVIEHEVRYFGFKKKLKELQALYDDGVDVVQVVQGSKRRRVVRDLTDPDYTSRRPLDDDPSTSRWKPIALVDEEDDDD